MLQFATFKIFANSRWRTERTHDSGGTNCQLQINGTDYFVIILLA